MNMHIAFDDYKVGDTIPVHATPRIAQMDLVRYAGASGDFNPIHTDPEYAKAAGLEKGTIVHGMYVMAQLGRLLSNWINPAKIKSFDVKFRAMVLPGEALSCEGKIKRKKEENGEKLLVVSVYAKVNDEVRVSGEALVLCD